MSNLFLDGQRTCRLCIMTLGAFCIHQPLSTQNKRHVRENNDTPTEEITIPDVIRECCWTTVRPHQAGLKLHQTPTTRQKWSGGLGSSPPLLPLSFISIYIRLIRSPPYTTLHYTTLFIRFYSTLHYSTLHYAYVYTYTCSTARK